MPKKKLSTETKVKLIYCGELIVIALIALLIGVLKMSNIIVTKPTRLLVYNIISTVGAAYFAFDFIWACLSPKRRKKVSLLDKVLAMPLSIYLVVFDIFCYIDKVNGVTTDDIFVRFSIGGVLTYLAIIYIFMGIYHYFHLPPQLIEAIEEAKEEERKALEEENKALEEKHEDVGDEIEEDKAE